MSAVPRRAPFVLAAAGAALLLAACGSSGGGSTATSGADVSPSSTSSGSRYGTTPTSAAPASSGATDLKLSADPGGQLAFDTSSLTAKAGTVTLTMANPSGSGLPHAVAVEGNGVDKDGATVQPGGTSTVTVKLKPGTYTFYCPVDGHKAAGMKGTLTVSS